MNEVKTKALNVFDQPLIACCYEPMTGYFRDGYCNTNLMDVGTHVVCAKVTNEFLKFSLESGNDLITPIPHWNFPGLKEGDFWCLCVSRWKQAEKQGVAPKVRLASTHKNALKYVSLEVLQKYALD